MIVTGIESDPELASIKADMLGSFLFFCRFFYEELTHRPFNYENPPGRESHRVTIARELTHVFHLRKIHLNINIPPGHGKSTIVSLFVAWAFAHYPDSKFLYISYSHSIAKKHTSIIKKIMSLDKYRLFFGVYIKKETSAKDHFETNFGGEVKAYGSGGSITGNDAGMPYLNRFSGCIIMDDMHKASEVSSDTKRENVITNYFETIKTRRRAPNIPMIHIGQALHQKDIRSMLIAGDDGEKWESVVLKAIDDNGNVLAPDLINKEQLLAMKEKNPYVFWSQFQQEPVPAGSSLFLPEWFVKMDEEPEIIRSFITVDTAATSKTYNDATVFSFFGIHKLMISGRDLGEYGIHWIDCVETRIEPSDLQESLLEFHSKCMSHKVKPEFIAIEKQSTGVTLCSVLSKIPGLFIRPIERTVASGDKSTRHISVQPFVAKRLVSLPAYAKHTQMCIDHCAQITANGTHAFDDIFDTLYDAIRICYVEQTAMHGLKELNSSNEIMNRIMSNQLSLAASKNKSYESWG